MGSNLGHGEFRPPTTAEVKDAWAGVRFLEIHNQHEVAQAISKCLQAYTRMFHLVPGDIHGQDQNPS